MKLYIYILFLLTLSCEKDLRFPRSQFNSYKKPTKAQLKSIDMSPSGYKTYMKYQSYSNTASQSEVRSLISYYRKKIKKEPTKKLRYQIRLASLIAMKARAASKITEKDKYARKSIRLIKKIEKRVLATKNKTLILEYYQTRARTFYQIPWNYFKQDEVYNSYTKAYEEVLSHLKKKKWRPQEELRIFFLEYATLEAERGNRKKAKKAAKLATKYSLDTYQAVLARQIISGEY